MTIKEDQWIWIIVYGQEGNEQMLGQHDSEADVSFIPCFLTKEEAINGLGHLTKCIDITYAIQAILYEDLKLYSIYSPPHHEDKTVHKTKEIAQADDEEFDGKITEGKTAMKSLVDSILKHAMRTDYHTPQGIKVRVELHSGEYAIQMISPSGVVMDVKYFPVGKDEKRATNFAKNLVKALSSDPS